MSDWQDISTAPKDGTIVDLWIEGPDDTVDFFSVDARKVKGKPLRHGRSTNWCWQEHKPNPANWYAPGGLGYPLSPEVRATHWMPLPQPPFPSLPPPLRRPPMADLSELIEKVKTATGPDPKLDEDVAHATRFRPSVKTDPVMSFKDHEDRHGYDAAWIAHAPWRHTWGIPRYTSSLDAVVALADEALGGVMWRVQSDPDTGDGFQATVITPTSDATAEGATPALALLLAILTAKEASNG